jgi:FtsZ-binding cell division protein ZapB
MMDLKAIETIEKLNTTIQKLLEDNRSLKREIIELKLKLNELDEINEYKI